MEKLRVLGKEGKKVDERLEIQVGFWMVISSGILIVLNMNDLNSTLITKIID